MRKTIFIFLLLLNLTAMHYGAERFFITFADTSGLNKLTGAELRHVYHAGMEDMRNFLFPGCFWLAGAMLINLVVAGVALFYKRST